MLLHQEELLVDTRGVGFYDLTASLKAIVSRAKFQVGLCHVFVRHTSASLVIQENADAAVQRDLQRWLSKLAPEGTDYEHDDEGPDDMPAHLRSAVTRTSETLPLRNGSLALGTWQAVYLWEHRHAPHQRTLIVTVQGLP